MNIDKLNEDFRIARVRRGTYLGDSASGWLIDRIEKTEKHLTPDDWSDPIRIGRLITDGSDCPPMNVIPSDPGGACQPRLLVIFDDKCCDFPSRLLEAAIHCIRCKETKEVTFWTPIWNSLIWDRYKGHFIGRTVSVRLFGFGTMTPPSGGTMSAPTPSGWERIDSGRQYTKRKPTEFRLGGGKPILVKNWNQLMTELCRILHGSDSSKFFELTREGAKPIMRGSRYLISDKATGLAQPMAMDRLPFFMATKFNSNNKVKLIIRLLERFDYKEEDLLIELR